MVKASIEKVEGRQILDSRGRPTVEVDVVLADGSEGRASAPSGASTGRHEAWELRDGEAARYGGLGVNRAVGGIRDEIARALSGIEATDQAAADKRLRELDGTKNLSRLGANAVLATSLAVSRAAAQSQALPLHRYLAHLTGSGTPTIPMPMTNILSGGAHAGRGMDIQDFLVVPVSATRYSEALSMICDVRAAASELMTERDLPTLLADEGGLSPRFASATDAMDMMMRAIERAGLRPGEDVAVTLDVAASELWRDGAYRLDGEKLSLQSDEMTAFVLDLVARYPILSVEDPLDQDDWKAWSSFTSAAPGIQIVGDDLFATNSERIAECVLKNIANAVLVKLNQNGTLTGTLKALNVARRANYAVVVSARSGETEDTFIADLAVGTGAGQIKIGSVRSSERLAKYNQLLRLEEQYDLPFAGMSRYAGAEIRSAAQVNI